MKKLLLIFLSLIFLLSGVCFSGCKSRNDCIPDKLGETEGLYLYYDNYRSLTDGTQTERLLNDITVEDATYSIEEYDIVSLAYMTNKKEIFYSLKTQKEGEKSQYFLWHYNYDTKENGWMRTLENRATLYTSEEYLLVQVREDYGFNSKGYLYDGNLNFISDGLQNYKLLGEMAYRYNNNTCFWWRNGQFFTVEVNEGKLDFDNILIHGEYIYLFMETNVHIVDINTGERQIMVFPQCEKFSSVHDDYGKKIVKNGKAYVLTYKTIRPTEYEWNPLETGCTLWALNGAELQRVYEFSNKYDVKFQRGYDDRYINLKLQYIPTWFNAEGEISKKKASYDLKNQKLLMGYEKGSSMPRTTFSVDQYEFYISSVTYGPLLSGYCCYYLHRITNGKDEIMQYHFDEKDDTLNPIQFEDIYIK